MAAALKSLAAIYMGVAALGAAMIGIQMLLPISGLGLPGDWATPVILGVVTATLTVSGALFWLSDQIVARMIGSPNRAHVRARAPEACFLCGAELLPGARTCQSCGALVRTMPR